MGTQGIYASQQGSQAEKLYLLTRWAARKKSGSSRWSIRTLASQLESKEVLVFNCPVIRPNKYCPPDSSYARQHVLWDKRSKGRH